MENNDNKASHTALVVRYRYWFRSFLDTAVLPEFESKVINLIQISPINEFRTRIFVGRGPFQHNLFAIPQIFFNQGERIYPTFTTPNISPVGAGMFATHKPRKFDISEKEAVCVIETSITHAVPDDFLVNRKTEQKKLQMNSSTDIVSRLLHEVQAMTEQAVGLYALYQYPLVWEPIETEPIASVINLTQKMANDITTIRLDCQVPFLLNVSSKINGNQLSDGVLTNLPKLKSTNLHFPLLLLQRTLWQKNVQLRFLEAFWLIDYMTSQHKPIDSERKDREKMYSLMSDYFAKEHPEFNARVQSLKHVVLQAPQRMRMQEYFAHLGILWNVDLMRRITILRNALSHARSVDTAELALLEGDTVRLAREVMRIELQARGFHFE